MLKYRYIVIWLNKNKNEYYYKKVKGTYAKYEKGFINQYNHEVILVIDIIELCIKRRKKVKTEVINRIIGLLNKLK